MPDEASKGSVSVLAKLDYTGDRIPYCLHNCSKILKTLSTVCGYMMLGVPCANIITMFRASFQGASAQQMILLSKAGRGIAGI